MVSPLCLDRITKRRACVIYLLPNCLHNLREMCPCPFFFTILPTWTFLCLDLSSFVLFFCQVNILCRDSWMQVIKLRWCVGEHEFQHPIVCTESHMASYYLIFFLFVICKTKIKKGRNHLCSGEGCKTHGSSTVGPKWPSYLKCTFSFTFQ